MGIGTTNIGSFKLAVEGRIGAREIVVTSTNTSGTLVYSVNNKVKGMLLIDLSGLAKGLYLLKAVCNESISTKKLIIN